MSFTIKELDIIHSALITRERTVREKWLPHTPDTDKNKASLLEEMSMIEDLGRKVCCAKLSLELGFHIDHEEVKRFANAQKNGA